MTTARLAAFALAGTLAVAPALLASPNETKATTVKVKTTTTRVETQSELQKEAKISMAQAEKVALKKAPGTVKSSELEREHGNLIYSFDINTKKGITEVNVNAITGAVVNTEHEAAAKEAAEKKTESKESKMMTSHAETQAQMQKEAKISLADARAIALKKAHGSVKSSELEREHGKLLYSFDIITKTGVTKVNVDAMNGSIAGTRHESATKEMAVKTHETKVVKH